MQAGDINRCHDLLPDIIGRAKEVYTDLLGTTTKSAFKRYFSSLKKVPSEGFGKLLQENNVRPLRPIMNNLRVWTSIHRDHEDTHKHREGSLDHARHGIQSRRPRWRCLCACCCWRQGMMIARFLICALLTSSRMA
jgi:hypothetical protein